MEIFSQFFWDEWIALLFGIVYVFLAAGEKVSAWVFGIISCGFWAYGTFVHYELYFNMALNVFYVIMGFYGIYEWMRGGDDGQGRNITEISIKKHLTYLLPGTVVSILLGYIFQQYTDAHAPFVDAFATVLSLIATVLLIYKIRSNWLYWIVADAIYLALYISSDADAYAILFTLNLLLAVYGYWNWKRRTQ